MTTFKRQRGGESNNCIFSRKYIGNGVYHQYAYLQGIEVGDQFIDTDQIITLDVTKIICKKDAKANNWTEEQCKDAYYEAEMKDPFFKDESTYCRLQNM